MESFSISDIHRCFEGFCFESDLCAEEVERGEVSEVVSHASCSVNDLIDCVGQSASFFSLSRSFVLVRPTTTFLRRVLPRKTIGGRPPFLVLFLSALLYLYMAIRTALANKVKSCTKCCGYGIRRCDLCEGHRVIWWEGKYKHLEPCPKCFGKRYVRCNDCGGMFGKSLFAHTSCRKLNVHDLKRIEKECKVDENWAGAPKWVV